MGWMHRDHARGGPSLFAVVGRSPKYPGHCGGIENAGLKAARAAPPGSGRRRGKVPELLRGLGGSG